MPEDGFSLYLDKGFFHAKNRVSLDKSGLRGAGQFDYLTSVTQSEDYVFFPDSMNTYAQSFNLPRTVNEAEFPAVSGNIFTSIGNHIMMFYWCVERRMI